MVSSHFWCTKCEQIVPIIYAEVLHYQQYRTVDGRVYQEGHTTDEEAATRRRCWLLEIEQAPRFH